MPPAENPDIEPDTRLAVYHVSEQSPVRLWELALGDRGVIMDTSEDQVYGGTGDGFVFALDMATCDLSWLHSSQESVVGLAVTGAEVVVSTHARITVLDGSDGRSLWTHVFSSPGSHSLAATSTMLAVSDGNHVGFFGLSGDELATLSLSDQVHALQATPAGVAVGFGASVGMWTWEGDPVWTIDVPAPAFQLLVATSQVFVGTGEGELIAIDGSSGVVTWRRPIGNFTLGGTLGAVDHGELHILELDFSGGMGRFHHLALGDGTEVIITELPLFDAFPEFDDGIVLVVDNGSVTARDLSERELWTIETGAHGLGRFTQVDVVGNLVVSITASGERF